MSKSTLVCPDPTHNPALVTLLEDIERKALVVYARLEGRGVAVKEVADLGEALRARGVWESETTTVQRSRSA